MFDELAKPWRNPSEDVQRAPAGCTPMKFRGEVLFPKTHPEVIGQASGEPAREGVGGCLQDLKLGREDVKEAPKSKSKARILRCNRSQGSPALTGAGR